MTRSNGFYLSRFKTPFLNLPVLYIPWYYVCGRRDFDFFFIFAEVTNFIENLPSQVIWVFDDFITYYITLVKLMFSKKATKIDEIFTAVLTFTK